MESRFGTIPKVVALFVAMLLAGCTMPVHIGITTTSPQDATITFDHMDDVIVPLSSVLQVTISESFDSYAWILDAATLAGQTSRTVAIDCTPLASGAHHLAAFVEMNGSLYSGNLRFRVEN